MFRSGSSTLRMINGNEPVSPLERIAAQDVRRGSALRIIALTIWSASALLGLGIFYVLDMASTPGDGTSSVLNAVANVGFVIVLLIAASIGMLFYSASQVANRQR
jgi:hypothetical protein